MAAMVLDIPNPEMEQIQERAEMIGMDNESVVQMAILDLLQKTDEDFKSLAEYLFNKNLEVLKRLA
jgi:hypothetical protein